MNDLGLWVQWAAVAALVIVPACGAFMIWTMVQHMRWKASRGYYGPKKR